MRQAQENKETHKQTNDQCTIATRKRKREVFENEVDSFTSVNKTCPESLSARGVGGGDPE